MARVTIWAEQLRPDTTSMAVGVSSVVAREARYPEPVIVLGFHALQTNPVPKGWSSELRLSVEEAQGVIRSLSEQISTVLPGRGGGDHG